MTILNIWNRRLGTFPLPLFPVVFPTPFRQPDGIIRRSRLLTIGLLWGGQCGRRAGVGAINWKQH